VLIVNCNELVFGSPFSFPTDDTVIEDLVDKIARANRGTETLSPLVDQTTTGASKPHLKDLVFLFIPSKRDS